MSLKFKCPKCNHNELEVVQSNVVITSLVVDITEEGYFEYDLTDSDGGHVDYYQCHKCGHLLKDANGKSITTEDGIAEWVKKNCCQESKAD